MFRALFAVLAAFMLSAAASAQPLSEDYRRLLEEAATHEDGAYFEAALRLVSRTAEGGAEAVLDAVREIAPDRIGAAQEALGIATTPLVIAGVEPPAVSPVTPEAEAEHPVPTGWRARIANGALANWSGRARVGLRWDSGNTDRHDYTLGLELRRELVGWGFQSKLEYGYSEVNGAVTRDIFLVEMRGEQALNDRWSITLGGQYETDAANSYDYTAHVSAGLAFRPLTGERMRWTLRAGPGARFLQPAGPGEELETNFAVDLGSDFEWRFTDTARFRSETTMLISEESRADQRFSLSARINSHWAVETALRYRHEFSPRPGFQEGDSRFDLSFVREF
ncbi:MAG: DUF481 domain-containing protein [Maricaulaceae bacterium]|nr:DUF481 domain-containing protein [Maricaulaceae bacterium]